jgi:hypothetical protein
MKPAQLKRSLKSLEVQTETLLASLSTGTGDVEEFSYTNAFKDYWSFYKEMIFYVRSYGEQSRNREIKMLAALFCNDNVENVEASIETYASIFTLFDFLYDDDGYRRSTSDLQLALRNVLDNVRNLSYQLELEDDA